MEMGARDDKRPGRPMEGPMGPADCGPTTDVFADGFDQRAELPGRESGLGEVKENDMKKPKTRKTDAKPATELWVVMRAYKFSVIEVYGRPLKNPQSGPKFFVPLFSTREEAVKWAGSEKDVFLGVVGPERREETT